MEARNKLISWIESEKPSTHMVAGCMDFLYPNKYMIWINIHSHQPRVMMYIPQLKECYCSDYLKTCVETDVLNAILEICSMGCFPKENEIILNRFVRECYNGQELSETMRTLTPKKIALYLKAYEQM